MMCRLGLEALDRPSRAQALKAMTKALEGPGPGLQICQALGQGFPAAWHAYMVLLHLYFQCFGGQFFLKKKLFILLESASTVVIILEFHINDNK